MRKFAHIINPVQVSDSSDLFVAQPVTFATMAFARDFAHGRADVSLFTAQYPEDRAMIPPYFQMTPDLERSVLDLGSFRKKRKLPLIRDVLDNLYAAAPEADYLIYTNVDIALMPQFYVSVDKFVEEGYDAFIINRRSIPKTYRGVDEIPLMYSDIGKSHPGFDCFVFRRQAYPRFLLGDICIGANLVGSVLLFNLVCTSRNFAEFKDKHLTFHIGDDMVWKQAAYSDYSSHNLAQTLRIITQLQSEHTDISGNGRYAYLIDYILNLRDEERKSKAAQGETERDAPIAIQIPVVLKQPEISGAAEIEATKKVQKRTGPVEGSRVICIMGMARCGTSMVARILNIMGMYLGPEENLILQTAYNKTGCWEHKTLLQISDSIIKTIQFQEFQQPGWVNNPALVQLEDSARSVIEREFSGKQFWGWKDDRCSVTLPFWQKIIPGMEYIICIRNPENAVKSLLKAKMIPSYDLAVSKWLFYITSAIRNTRDGRRLMLFYEDFLGDDWKSAVKKIAAFLGPSYLEKFSEYENEIEAFIKRDFQHHKVSVSDMLDDQQMPYAIKHFYTSLLRYEQNEELKDFYGSAGDREKAFREIAAYAHDESFRMCTATFTLHAKNKALESLQKSYSWRITSPLRKISDIFRGTKQ